MNKTTMTLTAAALMACASQAHALPTYTSGSFAIDAFTSVTTDVTTTTDFPITNPVNIGSPAGSMTLITLPTQLTLGSAGHTPINFLDPASLDFSNAGLGTFMATTATSVPSAANTATWDVIGVFTLGTDWMNAGTSETANEIFDLTQTGGPGNSISISNTFHSPEVAIPTTVPEPATLALLGSGLVSLAAVRRRKKSKKA